MNRKILFSPVGGTDPIAVNNYKDGSLLHITRMYKVDVVYMYMSYEMLKFREEDNRYLYCLEKLEELQNRKIVCHEIERPELKNVQEFDFFYNEFYEIIRNIQDKMDDYDELILNISSGTPAMKSGLLVLATLGEFNCKVVQVVTPTKKINEHTHIEYDVATLWELNEDNEPDCENRCIEVQCPTLSYLKQKEIIKKLVNEYDYSAALTAAKKLPLSVTEKYIDFLRLAQKRLQLDLSSIGAVVSKYNVPGFPVKSGNEQKYFEYFLCLDIKRKKGEFADLIRAISPLINDLFVMILKNECKVDIKDYTSEKNGTCLKWSPSKLENTDILKILESKWPRFRTNDFVYSSHLNHLLSELAADNTSLVTTVSALRNVEEKVRNLAAHNIISITDEKIKNLTGYTSLSVIKLLRSAFIYAGLNIKESYWSAYDDMNSFIIEKIEQ